MGNSLWRLETALNYVAERAREMALETAIEVLVTDWGSDVPLREVLKLSPTALRMVSFVLVPRSLAVSLQQDSPFPEVIALNVAARRANGLYIGRIDQDTLVGSRFLDFFFKLINGEEKLEVPVEKSLLFSNQRMVPFRFTVHSPGLPIVARFIERFGTKLTMEHRNPRSDFYTAGVGIWMVHRDLWHECQGYDERMIYMNAMETNMVRRLMLKYQLVNLGKLVNYDFYHLEHYHPHKIRKSSTHRKVNPRHPFSRPTEMQPNGAKWGLADYSLEVARGEITKPASTGGSLSHEFMFCWDASRTGFQLGQDKLMTIYVRLKHRAGLAWNIVSTEPLLKWPQVVMKRLNERRIARQTQPTD